MPSPSDKDPAQPSSLWSRASAIEAFGVRYVQRRNWRDPVVETLGAHPSAEEVLDGCRSFPTQGAAIQRAQAEAREEAVRELERCDAFLKARSVRLRLAIARTWRIARRRQVGILATSTILEQRRREQNSVLRNGIGVPVRRLPDPIRLPALLPLGQLVHVVDTRTFPRTALRIVGRPILAHSFVEAPSHPDFDQLVRYRVRDLDGLAYDHAGLGADRLSGSPSGVEVFLDPVEAERFVGGYATDVMSRLGRPEAQAPAIERVVEDEPLPVLAPVPVHAAPDGPDQIPSNATPSTAPPVAPLPPAAAAAAVGQAGVSPAGALGLEPPPAPSPETAPITAAEPPPTDPEPIAGNPPEPIAIDPVAPVLGLPGASADDAPRLEEADLRPVRKRKGLLTRLFSRRSKKAVPVEAEPGPSPAGPVEDHLPVGMIIDEMEAAVIELAAGAVRTQRPPLPMPLPPVPGTRHPETSAFLARGGLVLLTSAAPGIGTPALRMLSALLPRSAFQEEAQPGGDGATGEDSVEEPEPEGLAA